MPYLNGICVLSVCVVVLFKYLESPECKPSVTIDYSRFVVLICAA